MHFCVVPKILQKFYHFLEFIHVKTHKLINWMTLIWVKFIFFSFKCTLHYANKKNAVVWVCFTWNSFHYKESVMVLMNHFSSIIRVLSLVVPLVDSHFWVVDFCVSKSKTTKVDFIQMSCISTLNWPVVCLLYRHNT